MSSGELTTMVAANRLCLTCGTEYSGFISVCPEDQTRLTVLSQDERVGTVLAERYDILEIIGTGGMGTVYKARQRLINRIVAVKMLHKTMMSSADVLRRFQLEAQAASRLSLPNILTIYDFGLTEEGQPYMVMDYLNGTSLDKIILAQHHLEPVRALNIFIQACAALAHAHMHEVLHRDIKPSNIMLVNFDDQSDFVKIVDFGIAKMMNKIEGQSAELTKTGEVYGSPPYMSPEQCRGLELDNRADIYSLACVLYKSLVGKNPMQISGDSMPLQIMLKHINEKAPSFAEAAPDLFLSSKLEAVVFKALEKNPDDRYQTMLEFKEALEKVREVLVAESKVSQQMKESTTGDDADDESTEAAQGSGSNQTVAAGQSPRPRKQIADDPTPHLPNATVPLDQQLSATTAAALNDVSSNTPPTPAKSVAATDAAHWPEVTQGTLNAPKPQAPVSHNLSPSEFLSTLNSQLTQSAQTPSAQPTQPSQSAQSAPRPVPNSAPAPASPLLNIANKSPNPGEPQTAAAVTTPVPATPATPAPAPMPSAPSADAAKPAQPVARATFAEALQAALPSPDTQMLSIVQAPTAQTAATKGSQGNGGSGAENSAPIQDRRTAKSQSHHSLPAQPPAQNTPPQTNQQPAVRAQIVSNMPPAPSSQMAPNMQPTALNRQPSPFVSPDAQPTPTVQSAPNTPPSQLTRPSQTTPGAQSANARASVGAAAPMSAEPISQPAPSINLQQTVNTGTAPNVQINPTSSSRVKISQTLNEIPKADTTLPTLRETPALAADLPGTPVESKIPISVLDGIKAPNIKSTKANLDSAPGIGKERTPNKPRMRRFEEPAENAERSHRLSENRRQFIKHETNSSKIMLIVAGLAFVVILAAFFSFSYFNSLPKQAQTTPDATQQMPGTTETAAIDQKAQELSTTAHNQAAPIEAKHTPIAQTSNPANSSAGTASGTAEHSNVANEIASVAPAVAKPHKTHKARPVGAAAMPAATSTSAAPGQTVRRHAYSSYGTSY